MTLGKVLREVVVLYGYGAIGAVRITGRIQTLLKLKYQQAFGLIEEEYVTQHSEICEREVQGFDMGLYVAASWTVSMSFTVIRNQDTIITVSNFLSQEMRHPKASSFLSSFLSKHAFGYSYVSFTCRFLSFNASKMTLF